MALIDHIDAVNRDIYLSIDTVGATINPIDIYKEMRTLRKSDETLRKFDLYIAAFGNVFKGGGKYTERYAQCLQGTRLIPYDVSHELTINGVIITDDGQEGIACFDRTPLNAATVVDINYVPPQVEVIRTESEVAAIKQAAFGKVIYIDTTGLGYAGTGTAQDAYIGTGKSPSNNLADAVAIGLEIGVKSFIVNGALTVENIDLSAGYEFIATSPNNTFFTLVNTANVDKCEFINGVITGASSGFVIVRRSVILALTNFNGYFDTCAFEEVNVELAAGKTTFFKCFSNVDGSGSPTISLGNVAARVRGVLWTGGVKFSNKNDTSGFSWDHQSGHIQILSTVTAGELILRGMGRHTDNSTGTAVVNGTALLIGTRTIETVGFVAVKSGGASGTDFPNGTLDMPVATMADAIALCIKHKVKQIHVDDNVTTDGTEDLRGFIITGRGGKNTSLNITAGTLTEGLIIIDCDVNGTFDGLGAVIERCNVGNLIGMADHIFNSFLYGSVSLAGDLSIKNCSISPDSVNQVATIDFNSSVYKVIVAGWGAGIVEVKNMVTDSLCGMGGDSGRIQANALNAGGRIVNGGGIIVNTPNLETLDTVTNSSIAGATRTELEPELLQINDSNKILKNKTITDPVAGTLTVFEDDGITPLYVVNIWENVAGTTPYAGQAVNRRERLE